MYALSRSSITLSHPIAPPCTRLFSRTPSLQARNSKKITGPLWKKPLASGRVKAYDEALKYIRGDAANVRKDIEVVKTQWKAVKQLKEGDDWGAKELELRKKLEILEIQSKINLPEVRFRFMMGRYPFFIPVYRHLTEQRWRKDGMLDLLMERLYQMHAVPDLLPTFHPSLDLHIQFPRTDGHRTLRDRRAANAFYHTVEPGKFIAPELTINPPRVAATVFHTDTRLYTMLLLDPDVPNEETRSYQTYLHWLLPNIPLQASYRNIKIGPSTGRSSHTPYIPPHPQRGTPYHRYVLLLLPHLNPTQKLTIPVFTDQQRLGFDLREFSATWGLVLGPGGGAHMWREVWHEKVSEIYSDILRIPEPVYTRARKPDPYAEGREKKYFL
ncbi:phosphatidylethanolamine-binding protein [Hysterangium stoloniferum]|nr:phosphatidylethanolamine-binding protein [Hysterangium stoloniferum]